MKSKSFLNWLLVTSLVLAVIFSIQFFFRTRDVRTTQLTLQTEMARYQNNRTMLNLLVSDAMEYSKKNPQIKPILESVGVGRTPTNQQPATR